MKKYPYFLFLFFCAGTVFAQNTVNFERAMEIITSYFSERIDGGTRVIVLNFQSEQPVLSEYFADELTINLVNDNRLTILDRTNLDALHEEMNFQVSGFVSDESAQSIGKMLGAQTIISGEIIVIDNNYNLRLRAINVETAVIQGALNISIKPNSRIAALAGMSEMYEYDSLYSLAGKYNMDNKRVFAVSALGSFTGTTNGSGWSAGGTITVFERYWGLWGPSFFLSYRYFDLENPESGMANGHDLSTIGGGALLKAVLGEKQRLMLSAGISFELLFGKMEDTFYIPGRNNVFVSKDYFLLGMGYQLGVSYRITPNISLDMHIMSKNAFGGVELEVDQVVTPFLSIIGLGITYMIPY